MEVRLRGGRKGKKRERGRMEGSRSEGEAGVGSIKGVSASEWSRKNTRGPLS